MTRPSSSQHARVFLTAASIATALVLVSTTTSAQDRKCSKKERAEAQVLDVKAGAKYDNGDFFSALGIWQEAYTACPNYVTAWNIARSYEEMRAIVQAREAFNLYLTFKRLPAIKRRKAQAKIKALDELIERTKKIKVQAAQSTKDGYYDQAIQEYEQAFSIHSDPSILVSIAEVYEKDKKYQKGIDVLRDRALIMASLTKQDRTQIELYAAKLDRELEASLRPSGPGNGTGPGGGSNTDPGKQDDSLFSNRNLIIAGYSLAGLGAVSFLTGGALYLSSTSDQDKLTTLDRTLLSGDESVRAQRNALAQDLDDTNTWLVLSYSIATVSLVSSAACLYFGYSGSSESNASASKTPKEDQSDFSLQWGVTPTGAFLNGTF